MTWWCSRIGLPQMDGLSVLEEWRRAGKKMPVLLLTARDCWSDKVQGIDAGVRRGWRGLAGFHWRKRWLAVRALVPLCRGTAEHRDCRRVWRGSTLRRAAVYG